MGRIIFFLLDAYISQRNIIFYWNLFIIIPLQELRIKLDLDTLHTAVEFNSIF